MNRFITTALATSLALLAAPALAKGHDQGVADGAYEPGTQTGAKAVIDTLEDLGILDAKGVSAVVKGGANGDAASDAGGDNRVTPTVGN